MGRIFVVIQPWTIRFSAEILASLDEYGERVYSGSIESPSMSLLKKFYDDCIGKPYYLPMIEDLEGKRVHVAVYEGNPKIFVGLKPEIRRKYASFIPPHPNWERDAIHISDDESKAKREEELYASSIKIS
jgi:nucleoside diphosphate kinase